MGELVKPQSKKVRQELVVMQAEFDSSQLRVALVPLSPNKRGYNEGGCKRVAVEVNARWYRDFCRQHSSSRRRLRRNFDTRIKRRNVAILLDRLLTRGSTSKYAAELIRIAEERLKAKKPSFLDNLRGGSPSAGSLWPPAWSAGHRAVFT